MHTYIYTLWQTNIATGKSVLSRQIPFKMDQHGGSSMAMLVYRSVYLLHILGGSLFDIASLNKPV